MFYRNYICILTCRYVYTHMHIHHRSMRSALEGFLIEVSIMTDNSFLVTGINSNLFLFPLWLWPLTLLAMCGALDGSGLWSYPSSLIEFILSLSFAGVFERLCFSSLTRGRQSVCVCLHNVSPAFILSSAQHTPHLVRERICRTPLLVISNVHSLRMSKGT